MREVRERIVRRDTGKGLPTIRSLAEGLGKNSNTVSRAYRTMEQEGILGSRVGRETWVKKDIKEKLQKEV